MQPYQNITKENINHLKNQLDAKGRLTFARIMEGWKKVFWNPCFSAQPGATDLAQPANFNKTASEIMATPQARRGDIICFPVNQPREFKPVNSMAELLAIMIQTHEATGKKLNREKSQSPSPKPRKSKPKSSFLNHARRVKNPFPQNKTKSKVAKLRSCLFTTKKRKRKC
jgi:hypothetical protein